MRLDPRQWTRKQLTIVAVCTVVFIVLLGFIIFMWVKDDVEEKTPTSDALTTAEQATKEGDYDEALSALQNAENKAKTDEEKIRLYSDLAAAAANAGKLQEAIDYYAQKHELDPEAKNADGYLVGELYERMENPEKALENYKLFLLYAETLSSEEFGEAQVENIKARIAELESQQ